MLVNVSQKKGKKKSFKTKLTNPREADPKLKPKDLTENKNETLVDVS